MPGKLRLAAIFLFLVTGVVAEEQQNAVAIRAGRNLATSVCCHAASPNQALAPVMGPSIPSFQDIANRPGVTAEG
jgi:hypothetical protein